MTEIVIGVLFAAWFVTAYLLMAKFLGPRRRWAALWQRWTRDGFDAAQLAGDKRPQLFLTTDALSHHHARAAGRSAAATEQQQPQRYTTDRKRR